MMREKYLSFIFIFHLPCLIDALNGRDDQNLINEAVFESYLPLISHFRNMERSAGTIPVNLAVSTSFIEMISGGSFRKRFEKYADNFARALSDDMKFFAECGKKRLVRAAEYWLDRVDGMISLFDDIDGDIVYELGELGRKGLELMATAATSNYLPLINSNALVSAQIRLGLKSFEEAFGYTPHGFWLPSDQYKSGSIGNLLSDAGIEYLVARSSHPPVLGRLKAAEDRYGGKNILQTLSKEHSYETGLKDVSNQHGINAGRDSAASLADEAEKVELIFIEADSLRGETGYLNTERRTFPGGICYWSNSGGRNNSDESGAYEYEEAAARASEQSVILLDTIRSEVTGKESGLIIAPFDTIINGEPWHEAPLWVEKMFLNIGSSGVKAITISDYMKNHETVTADSGTNDEIYAGRSFTMPYNQHRESILGRLHKAEARFETVLTKYSGTGRTEIGGRVVKQMARELLILQSTDLQLLISSNRHGAYAEKTMTHHLEQFDRLAEISELPYLGQGIISELETIEKDGGIFRSIDPSLWMQ